MAAAKPQPDGTLIKALARAWRWQRMLDEGVYATVSEIGDAENISKSYMSRILRLALLAPDIVEEVLAGRSDLGQILGQLERIPASWGGAAAAGLDAWLIASWRRVSPTNRVGAIFTRLPRCVSAHFPLQSGVRTC